MIVNNNSSPAIHSPGVKTTLDKLYAETVRVDPLVRKAAREKGLVTEGTQGFYRAMREAYMPVTPDMGMLLYLLARTIRARTIVEYGMSFGISTIFLAAALRDNGGGVLVTTEIEQQKAERAHRNLAEAGLGDLVEIRIGDAAQTLSGSTPAAIDFVLLDGAKSEYLNVLKVLQPNLQKGALIAADNSEMAGVNSFLEYICDPRNGYVSSALFTQALGAYHGNQVVMRL